MTQPDPDVAAAAARHASSGSRSPIRVNGTIMPASAVAAAVEDSARVALVAMDLSGTLIHASPGFCELTGWDQADLIGAQPPLPFWPPEHVAAITAMVQNVMAGAIRPSGYDLTLLRKNGERFEAHSLINRLYDDEGSHIGWVNATRDVGHERTLERQIRSIAMALTGSPEGLALADADDRYIYANEMFAELCGNTVAQLLGRRWQDLNDDHHSEHAQAELARTLHNPADGTFEREIQMPGPAGTSRSVSLQAVALWGPNRRYLGHIGYARDTTRRHQREHELLKLRSAVEASGEAIFLTDREGLITFANSAFSKLYGHDLQDVVGKVTPRILKSGIYPPERYAQFWQKILAKTPLKGELTNRTTDGRLIEVDNAVDPILGADGEILGAGYPLRST